MRQPPFQLVDNEISRDTLEALEKLCEGARNGTIIGVAFCVMYKGRQFFGDTAGEAWRNPVFTRGMLAYLDDKLADRGFKEGGI